MDDDVVRRARRRSGLVLLPELGAAPARTGRRHGLVEVQPRVLVAATQPVGLREQVAAVVASVPPPLAFTGWTALWLHGAAGEPRLVEVAVRADQGVTVRPPVVPHRLVPRLLDGLVVRQGVPVVALEVAAVQAAADRSPDSRDVLLSLIQSRRTTPGRLLRVCGRGFAGSAAVRALLREVGDGATDRAQRLLVAALTRAGVTGLEQEVRLVSASGAVCYLDLLHRPSRRALEVDGLLRHSDPAQMLLDRRRDRWVRRDHGVETTRVMASEVLRRLPELVIELLPLLHPRAS